jgi:hypothetical protein
MDAQKFAVPLLAFAGGAILGRVLGLKTLVRGAMTAAAVTGIASPPAMIASNGHQRAAAARRKPARRKTASKSAKRSASRARSA